MNDFDALVSSFINERPSQQVSHEEAATSFINVRENLALQGPIDIDLDELFETQAVERAFISLRSDKRYLRYTQDEIDKMYELVRRYIHMMGSSYIPSKTLFRIDDMSSRSIEVRFSQRADVSLNLYVGKAGESEYEETYISYQEGNESIITNDTMDRMVTLVKQLIGE